ncbi:MAG: hypothetical protein J7L75_00070 [Thermoproteales archaeon]|nr:hypothetical protein [Thermoproteales archaeon]
MTVVYTDAPPSSFRQVAALRGLNMRASEGVSGRIRPNGAGKTTTIHMPAGLRGLE